MAEPFGTTAPETNPSGLGQFTFPLRMPGQYADAESGLFYNMNRQLDSSINRYTQSDSIGLAGGSLSPYVYADNNPLSNVDPNGLKWVCYVPAGGCHWVLDPPINPDYPHTPAPPSFTWPKLLPDSFVDWVIGMCTDTPEECRKKCDAANTEQVRICKMAPTARAREACYSRANELYGQCLKNCK